MMLNNPALTPGIRTRSSNALHTPSLHMSHTDENSMSIHRSKMSGKGLSESRDGGSGKTRSRTTERTRRAFGDISNQESSRLNFASNNGTLPRKPMTSSTIKPSKSVSFQHPKSLNTRSQKLRSKGSSSTHKTTRSSSLKSSRKLKSKTPKDKIKNRLHDVDKNIETTHKTKKSSFEIPSDAMLQAEEKQKIATFPKPKSAPKPFIPFEDIELPAGRLWREDELESDTERSFSLGSLKDFHPSPYEEEKIIEEQRLKEMREKYQLDLNAGLEQEEADFNAALDLMDNLEIFIDDDQDLMVPEEISIDNGYTNEQIMIELDELSI